MGQNATFSASAGCSSLRQRLLHLGKATCLQLALSSFTSAKDRFTLANPRVVLAGCSPFTLAKVCFALANRRPSLSSIGKAISFLLFLASSMLALLSILAKHKQIGDQCNL